MWVEELGRDLTGHRLAIWQGRSSLTRGEEAAYRNRWLVRAGRHVPPPELVVVPDDPQADVENPLHRYIANACVHLSDEPVGLRQCPSCRGNVRIKEFICGVGRGVEGKAVPSLDCGTRCKGYQPRRPPEDDPRAARVKVPYVPPPPMPGPLRWAYGVTTVPERFDDLLPRTLESLKLAGFDRPRLFVDGLGTEHDGGENRYYRKFGLEVTARWPRIRTHLNWFLAFHELFGRNPDADRYAIFQDDFVTVRNLRAYLDHAPYPPKGYLNLYTMPSNQELVPRDLTANRNPKVGFYPSNQFGRGAVALVFDREATLALLGSAHMIGRPMDPNRGHKVVDGGILESMKKVGFTEYVHHPSLVQHTGMTSTVESGRQRPASWLARSYPGEDFDALSLLPSPIAEAAGRV